MKTKTKAMDLEQVILLTELKIRKMVVLEILNCLNNIMKKIIQITL